MKTLTLTIAKVTAYIEDFCAVIAFASDESPQPKSYLTFTRETQNQFDGKMLSDLEWDLMCDYDGEIDQLTDYEWCSDHKLRFYFDHKAFCLELNLLDKFEIELDRWLVLFFEKEK